MIPEFGSWLMSVNTDALHAMVLHLPHIGSIDPSHSWLFHHDWTLMQGGGDAVYSQDLAGSFQKGWNNFVKTGQVWAMLFGIVLGYMIRQFTSFG